jgi:hypothetical protein
LKETKYLHVNKQRTARKYALSQYDLIGWDRQSNLISRRKNFELKNKKT